MSATHFRRVGAIALMMTVGAALIFSVETSASTDTAGAGKARPATITAFVRGGKMGFKGPRTVKSGAELRIVNATDPRKVGPHTFTLLNGPALPRSRRARSNCEQFRSRLCVDIVKAHRANPRTGTVKRPNVDVGKKGWDHPFGRTGDTWFTAVKGQSTERTVSARPGTTLYYFCAIHPWMWGKIRVVR